jgi:hypothetical protein
MNHPIIQEVTSLTHKPPTFLATRLPIYSINNKRYIWLPGYLAQTLQLMAGCRGDAKQHNLWIRSEAETRTWLTLPVIHHLHCFSHHNLSRFCHHLHAILDTPTVLKIRVVQTAHGSTGHSLVSPAPYSQG